MKYSHDKKAPCLFVVETQCETCASGGKMKKASLSCIIHIPKINLLLYSKLYLISHLKYLLFLSLNVQIRETHMLFYPLSSHRTFSFSQELSLSVFCIERPQGLNTVFGKLLNKMLKISQPLAQ